MAWVSKYDTTFMVYVRKRYNKRFTNYDSFSDWLFFEKWKEDYEEFYVELENVIREYSDWQTNKVKEDKEIE